MSRKHIRRSMPLLPIGIVMQLTELSARQIRYYEEHQLITPARTEGNRRLYTLNDVDQLLEIKDLLEQGVNIAGIKKIFTIHIHDNEDNLTTDKKRADLSDEGIRRILREELLQAGRFQRPNTKPSEVGRYFH